MAMPKLESQHGWVAKAIPFPSPSPAVGCASQLSCPEPICGHGCLQRWAPPGMGAHSSGSLPSE